MTDTELRESVSALGGTVRHLTDVISQQALSQSSLAVQVKESNERAVRDRKVLRILTGLVVFKLMTLLVLFFVIVQINESNDTLRDCIDPAGQCAQRNGRQAQAAFLAVEAVRLQTEIPLAEQRGDTIAAEYRKQRLAEIQDQINKIRVADKIPAQTTTTSTTIPRP